MADRRTYILEPKSDAPVPDLPVRLIKATHPTGAMAHMASSLYKVRVATQEDLEKHLPAGVEVEIPGEEKEPPNPARTGRHQGALSATTTEVPTR